MAVLPSLLLLLLLLQLFSVSLAVCILEATHILLFLALLVSLSLSFLCPLRQRAGTRESWLISTGYGTAEPSGASERGNGDFRSVLKVEKRILFSNIGRGDRVFWNVGFYTRIYTHIVVERM
jgi:hypothetical protein